VSSVEVLIFRKQRIEDEGKKFKVKGMGSASLNVISYKFINIVVMIKIEKGYKLVFLVYPVRNNIPLLCSRVGDSISE